MSPRGASVAQAAVPGPGRQRRLGGWPARLDDVEGLGVASTSSIARATMPRNGFVRIRRRGRSGPGRGERMERRGVEPDPRRRTEDDAGRRSREPGGRSTTRPGSRRTRPADFGRDVEAVRRNDDALRSWGIRPGCAGRPGRASRWKSGVGNPATRSTVGDVARLRQDRDLRPAEAPEAAEADRHRVDGPPADELDDAVAGLFEQIQLRPRGRVEGARVAEEVGQVEEVDMECVTLDPLPPLWIDRDVERVLERMNGRCIW